MPIRVLITGGAGFIGHHFVNYLLNNTDWELTLIDRLDYSGNLNRLADIGLPDRRVRVVFHDLRAEINEFLLDHIPHHNYIVHMAAATHVDRSIENPLDFVMNNVVATCNLLTYALNEGCDKFIYFSTDEVFGPAPKGVAYKEWDRYKSGNPYAATKAGAEELAIAFENTYRLPVIVTHTMNVFGYRQNPEKFIPGTIKKVLNGEEVLIHSNKEMTEAGSRFYIHANHVADAIYFLLQNGEVGEKYNIVGEKEVNNLDLAKQIARVVGKELHYKMVDFHSSRPGHDLRYALDGSYMKKLGWVPPQTFEDGIVDTVRWYLDHPQWL